MPAFNPGVRQGSTRYQFLHLPRIVENRGVAINRISIAACQAF